MRDSDRLFTLKQLITNSNITTQQQLIELMAKRGFQMTQSSLSRDLSAIHAVKMTRENGEKIYVIQPPENYVRVPHSMPMQAENQHWFVLHVRMFHEKKVLERLKAKGMECWIPSQTVRRKWSDRIKVMEVLVITKCVFVHCTEIQRKDAFDVDTMGYFMDYVTGHPAIIPDDQMHTFMSVVEKSSVPVEFTEELLQPGEQVLITSGQFVGETAELCKYRGSQKVVIRLNGLGSAIMAVDLSEIIPLRK